MLLDYPNQVLDTSRHPLLHVCMVSLHASRRYRSNDHQQHLCVPNQVLVKSGHPPPTYFFITPLDMFYGII